MPLMTREVYSSRPMSAIGGAYAALFREILYLYYGKPRSSDASTASKSHFLYISVQFSSGRSDVTYYNAGQST